MCRMWWASSLSGSGWARSFQVLWYGLSHTFPNCHGWQLERHNEGHIKGRMRRWRRLLAKLLRFALFRSTIFCGFCANGTICVGQRGSCRPHETLGGVAQTGKAKLHTPRNLFKLETKNSFEKTKECSDGCHYYITTIHNCSIFFHTLYIFFSSCWMFDEAFFSLSYFLNTTLDWLFSPIKYGLLSWFYFLEKKNTFTHPKKHSCSYRKSCKKQS